jgi:hypothetical protein
MAARPVPLTGAMLFQPALGHHPDRARWSCEGSGVSDGEHYRNQSEECRQMAAKAVSPTDKEAWLHLAEDWLRLAESVDRRDSRRREP